MGNTEDCDDASMALAIHLSDADERADAAFARESDFRQQYPTHGHGVVLDSGTHQNKTIFTPRVTINHLYN